MATNTADVELQSVSGKAVIVTGGTTGIGRAIARLLATQGARVFIFGRHDTELNEALGEIRGASGNPDIYGITADSSRTEDVRRVFQEADQRLGGLDILVNNAAISDGNFGEQELEEMEYVVRTNVVGYISCAHEAVQQMKGRDGAHIVNIGSMSADLREEGSSVYVATKAAIQAFSESLRKTVNSDGIKVTLVEPGKVATDMVDQPGFVKKVQESRERMLKPEDIAACVYFCLTQPARCDIVSVQIRPHLQVI